MVDCDNGNDVVYIFPHGDAHSSDVQAIIVNVAGI